MTGESTFALPWLENSIHTPTAILSWNNYRKKRLVLGVDPVLNHQFSWVWLYMIHELDAHQHSFFSSPTSFSCTICFLALDISKRTILCSLNRRLSFSICQHLAEDQHSTAEGSGIGARLHSEWSHGRMGRSHSRR